MATAPSLSLVDNRSSGNATSVGNYKGVMLCNRPFAGTVGKVNSTKSGEPSSFSCGVVPETLGQTVLPSSKEKYKIFRSKKDSVLSKHRRWLAELQKTKDSLEERYVEEMQRKEEAKKQFIEHESKLRSMARSLTHKEGDQPETSPSKEASTGASASEAKASAKAPGKGGKSKPAWAMSEKQAEDKKVVDEDLDVEGDAAELLDFAEGLSYEKFIGDIEVQAMVEKLKKRVLQLEREVAQEDQRETDAEERSKKRELLATMDETAQLMSSGMGEDFDGDEELAAAAKALLKGDEEMQSIHSAKSVTALLRATREAVADGKGRGKDGVVRQSNAANEPMIVVHDASEGSRLEAKKNINNLPYMHRNPAV